MPTYTYECAGCSKIHEIVHSIHEYITSCPDCGRNLVRVIITPPAFRFKGGSPTKESIPIDDIYDGTDLNDDMEISDVER